MVAYATRMSLDMRRAPDTNDIHHAVLLFIFASAQGDT